MYTIEDHIPIPEEKPRIKELLGALEIGQSIQIPAERKGDFSSVASRQYHAKTDKRFVVGTTGEPEGKARVWRKA